MYFSDTISGMRPRYRRTTVKTINYLPTTTPFKGLKLLLKYITLLAYDTSQSFFATDVSNYSPVYDNKSQLKYTTCFQKKENVSA